MESVLGFPHSSVGKESACNAGDSDSIPGWGRAPGEGNGNPFQDSCLENPMDRGARQILYHWGVGGAWLESMGSQRVGHD